MSWGAKRSAHSFFAITGSRLATVQVASRLSREAVQPAVDRALQWLTHVDGICGAEAGTELTSLPAADGPVPVSFLLARALHFSLRVAEATNGASSPVAVQAPAPLALSRAGLGSLLDGPSWKDVHVDLKAQTVALARPVQLDLGPVAVGLGLDLAARELARFDGFRLEAGDAVLVGGRHWRDERRQIVVRRPDDLDGQLAVLQLARGAVGTAFGSERVAAAAVVARSATVAGAIAQAVVASGPCRGMRLLEQQQLDGLLVTPDMTVRTTPGMLRYL